MILSLSLKKSMSFYIYMKGVVDSGKQEVSLFITVSFQPLSCTIIYG